jgi:hypothetical protein
MTGVKVVVATVGQIVLVGVKLQSGIRRVILLLIISVFKLFKERSSSFEMENRSAMLASVSLS